VSTELVPVTVSILGKEYKVACPREEQSALIAAATFLDERMREIRESGKVIGGERIAVMAALNLAHEYLDEKASREGFCSSVRERVDTLNARIDTAMRGLEAAAASSSGG